MHACHREANAVGLDRAVPTRGSDPAHLPTSQPGTGVCVLRPWTVQRGRTGPDREMAMVRHNSKKVSKSVTEAFPAAHGYPVSSRALKVRILSGSLSDTVKGPCTGTVGVWSESKNGWAVPPMILDMIVDGSTFYYPGAFLSRSG